MNRIGVTQLEDAFALTLSLGVRVKSPESKRMCDYSDFSPCFYPAKIRCRHWIPAFAGMTGWRQTFVTHPLKLSVAVYFLWIPTFAGRTDC